MKDHAVVYLFTAAILAAWPVRIAPAAEGDGDAPIDPKAMAVVNAWAGHLQSVDAWQQTVRMRMNIEAEGMKNEMTSIYRMALDKPNKFALVLQRGIHGATIVSDGERLTTHMPMMKRYTVEDAPGTFAELSENPMLAMLGMSAGGFGPAQVFVTDDPVGNMMEGVDRVEYAGVVDRHGVATHHLKFYQEQFDWEAWFRKDGAPVLLEIKPDLAKAFAAMEDMMSGMMDGMRMETSMIFEDWREGDVDASLFVFVPPADTEQVDSLLAGGEDEAQTGMEDEGGSLVGREAPGFKLALLDGGDMDLAAHAGKQIVVLDFWATWCPPCVRGLPAVSAAAAAYKDEGVVFYAVNVREKPETIREFLKKKGLNVSVALDTEGEVSSLYEVSGIPQTVVIDRSGKIADLHIGYAPGLEDQLRETLAKLTGADGAETE